MKTITVKEMIRELEKLDQDDLVVLAVPDDVDKQVEFTYHTPDVVGRQGFDEVCEIHVGGLISG